VNRQVRAREKGIESHYLREVAERKTRPLDERARCNVRS